MPFNVAPFAGVARRSNFEVAMTLAGFENDMNIKLRSSILSCSKAFSNPLYLFIGIVTLYGFGHTDFQDFTTLTRNPFVTLPEADRQFLHSSPLGFFLGWPLTRLLNANASYLLVTVGGVVLLGLALKTYLRRVPAERRRTILLVFLSSPLLIVILRWFGKDDPYVLAFFLLYAASRRNRLAAAVFSLLIVLGHKEIGTIIILGDGILRRSLPLGALAGIVVGHLLVAWYHVSLNAPLFSRVDLAVSFIGHASAGWEANPVAHLALGLGWFWIPLGLRWREDDGARVVSVVLLCFAAAFTTADFTRDLILCAAPLVLHVAEEVAASPAQAAFVATPPFPFVFLIQAQLMNFDQVRDSNWLPTLLDWFQKMG